MRENKSLQVLAYLNMLTATGAFKPASHTHERIYQLFEILARRLADSDALLTDDDRLTCVLH